MRHSLYAAIATAALASLTLAACATPGGDPQGGLFGSCADGVHAYYCPVYGGTVQVGSLNGGIANFRGLPYRDLPDGRRFFVYGTWLPDFRTTVE